MKRSDMSKVAVAAVLGLACAMPAIGQSSQGQQDKSSAQGQNASGGQTTDLNANRGREDRDWGWIGLLGLAGLLGLRRRDRDDYGTPRRTTT